VLHDDERALLRRLSRLDRCGRTAFAAACAERLLPLFASYTRSEGRPVDSSRLAEVLAASWAAAAGQGDVSRDAADLAESLVPSDESGWTDQTAFAQNAAAAVAYAARTWRADSAQDATWAARQVYEMADYAVGRDAPPVAPDQAGVESAILRSDLVQRAFAEIAGALDAVEGSPSTWAHLRAEAEADGLAWLGRVGVGP
jgi:hypothetical protein